MPSQPASGRCGRCCRKPWRGYRADPSEFLEDTIVGLMRMLDMEPDRSWCDDQAQGRNAPGRPAAVRVRDYLSGTDTAMAWACGQGPPPLSIVLTAGQGPEDGDAL